jgi:hypothetical protein
MSSPVEAISSSAAAMVVPAAFGVSAPAAGVSPSEFAAVFRHYSKTNIDEPPTQHATRIAHINMGLRVVGTPFIDEHGGRSWWAY